MKMLHFDYQMEVSYSIPVDKCYYTIKCIPMNCGTQRLESYEVSFEPETKYSIGQDGFSNSYFYGREDVHHKTFTFGIKGVVTTGLKAEKAEDDMEYAVYRYPYGLNESGERIRAYHDTFEFTNDMSTYQKAEMMMRRLYQDFVYQKHVTDCNTGAEDAFILGKGGCQDYAHILIALCHLEKIPARYVAGMMIGEGASHAWVEICQDGIWYGLDPTNNKLVDDDYIKLSHGRDASDCLINRGVIVGGGEQTQDIKVHVWEE